MFKDVDASKIRCWKKKIYQRRDRENDRNAAKRFSPSKIQFRIAVKPFVPTGGSNELSLTVELLRYDTITQHLVKSAAR